MSLLECRGLTKQYGRKAALSCVDLTLESGRIVGLAGPNGSGKTTMIKLIQHLLTPTSGEILVDGKHPGTETKKIVSYLPDRDFLPDWMSVRDLLTFYEKFFADFNREKALNMLSHLQLETGDNTPLKKMSKGTREKVQLILTMSRDAKVYLLDEPIAGVDPATRDYIIRTIITNYSENALVLISTHLIADVEPVLDEVIFLKDGSIYLHESTDSIRERTGQSIDHYFREVFKCSEN
ncbi:ABC transporter ATP-binding protein [[Clostridium] aminophilum]|uniref:ABC-2 type transport system ATP-binding protein n=1 Tax=[Clostridium] aminophilum TaxID=1526 RepID=A0A1I6K8T8_9FIRM|nr:ABC transporter ATP-binding protein [[Clostridium] aminophilum]SFR87632.1 ABC-2 type transport system ATP-binding protein [[Clostridium] aminophilum]